MMLRVVTIPSLEDINYLSGSSEYSAQDRAQASADESQPRTSSIRDANGNKTAEKPKAHRPQKGVTHVCLPTSIDQ